MINKVYTERELLYGPAMNVVFSVELEGEVNIEWMKIAITYAVNRFESLKSRIEQFPNGEAYYVMQDKYFIPQIEVRDYHLEEEEFINEQERIPFAFNEGELIRFVIEKIQDLTIMRIICHHLAGDGNSIINLIHEILTNLEEMEKNKFGFKSQELIPLKTYEEEELKQRVKIDAQIKNMIEQYNIRWKKEEHIFDYEEYLEMFHNYWAKHRTRVASGKISRKVINKLVSLCRENNVTLNSAFITAALRQMGDLRKIVIIVDTRPEEIQGMGNYAGSMIIQAIYDEKKNFWENVQELHEKIYRQLNDRTSTLFSLMFKSLLNWNLQDAIIFQTVGNYDSLLVKQYTDSFGYEKADIAMNVSNLGADKLNDTYGNIRIKNLEFSSPLIPGLNCIASIITMGDAMTIMMEYNEKYGIDYAQVMQGVIEEFNGIVSEADNLEYTYL